MYFANGILVSIMSSIRYPQRTCQAFVCSLFPGMLLVLCIVSIVLSGCSTSVGGNNSVSGTGSAGKGGADGSTGSYTLSASAKSFTVSAGVSQTITVTVQALSGFNATVTCSLSGLPFGVTATPANFDIVGTGSKQVQFSLGAGATNGTSTVTVNSSSGALSQQAQFQLAVAAESSTLQISFVPSALNIPAGSANSIQVQMSNSSVSPATPNIAVQLSTPPSGVTVTPSSFTVAANGGTQTVFVKAANNASSGTLNANAIYGSAQQSASLTVTIGAAENYKPVSLSTSDKLVRTDALTPYTSFPPPNYLIYHAATNRFFSTDAVLNQLNVVNASTQTLTTTLTIPGAFGIDQAPDGSVLYVGTMVGDLYVVDPVQLTILKRYASTTISPYGFPANAVYALADGKLILEQYFLVPGYSIVDGDGPIALWDPASNSITVFAGTSGPNGLGDVGYPTKPSCLAKFEQVMLTNNRTRILLVPVLTSEGSSVLCSLDPEADTWNWSQPISGGGGSALTAFAVTFDGNTLVAYDGYDIYTLDAATFAVKSSFPVSTTQGVFTYPVLFLSQDNKSVFITDSAGPDVSDVYNLATGKLAGWIPQLNLASPGSYTTGQPLYQAMASNGVAAGVIFGGGVGLLDTTAVHSLPVGTRFTQTQLDVPYGPAAGGTATSWLPYLTGSGVPSLGSVYFGANVATGLDNSGGMLFAVSPAGSPGPVDVRTFATDGGSQLLPQGFTYGPWVLESPTMYSTAEGGGPGSLYGYGFGPQGPTNSALYVAPPPDLQVTVGGVSATVTGFSPNPYLNLSYFVAPPLPTNGLRYTVPAGAAGNSASITVTNSSGSTTTAEPIRYLPSVQQYAVPGELADGIYDPTRHVYYFTDTNQVRVFSLTQGKWLASIPIPAPKNAYAAQRLLGIALSPDGSKLAVSDPGAIAIYIINPDQPSSIQSYAYASQIGTGGITAEPSGIAVTNSGIVYFVTFDLNGDGGCGFMFSLDPSTGTLKNVGLPPESCLPTQGPDPDGRLVTTADGSRIYFNDAGYLGYVDTISGQVVSPINNDSDLGEGGYEIVMGANQTRLFADGFFTDSNLNTLGLQALNAEELDDASYVYGAVLSTDGSLFFQPGSQAIDLFDGCTGAFRGRVALPTPLSPNYRALVSNNEDSRLVAITGATGNGIAVIDLNSLPEPNPLPWLSPEASPLASGSMSQLASTDAESRHFPLPSLPKIYRRSSPLSDLLKRARISNANSGLKQNPTVPGEKEK